MSEASTVLLILGMHRSGTSALTRVLNLCGVDLGSRLMAPAADNNQHGFWEHLDVVDIDERLLHNLGRSWWDTRRLPDGWLDVPAAVAARPRIAALVSEFGQSPLWALKDPRICRFLPLWVDGLRAVGVTVKLIFMLRHPAEVQASLERRDGISSAESGLLLLNHFFEAAFASAGLPRCVVTYQSLIEDWHGCMTRIARELDVELPLLDTAGAQVEQFLSPGARHHRFAEDDAELNQSLNGRVYALARGSADSAAFWADTALLGEAWELYQNDLLPYVDELMNMLAVRSAMDRRELKQDVAARQGDGRTMSPLAHLQFRMITGLQDGMGRLGQACADLAAMVRIGTESVGGISGETATAVAALREALGVLHSDMGQLSGALGDELQSMTRVLIAQVDSLRQQEHDTAAGQQRQLSLLEQRTETAAMHAAERHEQLGRQLADVLSGLEAAQAREQRREEQRWGRRLRGLLSRK